MNRTQIILEIRKRVRNGFVVYSEHLLDDKLNLLDLTVEDVNNVMFTGVIVEIQNNDERGARYVILGNSLGSSEFEVVCRFIIEESVLLITVYERY